MYFKNKNYFLKQEAERNQQSDARAFGSKSWRLYPRKYQDAPGIAASLSEPKRSSESAVEEVSRLRLQTWDGAEATRNLEVEQKPIWQQGMRCRDSSHQMTLGDTTCSHSFSLPAAWALLPEGPLQIPVCQADTTAMGVTFNCYVSAVFLTGTEDKDTCSPPFEVWTCDLIWPVRFE